VILCSRDLPQTAEQPESRPLGRVLHFGPWFRPQAVKNLGTTPEFLWVWAVTLGINLKYSFTESPYQHTISCMDPAKRRPFQVVYLV
jgi:hypothetical protein